MRLKQASVLLTYSRYLIILYFSVEKIPFLIFSKNPSINKIQKSITFNLYSFD